MSEYQFLEIIFLAAIAGFILYRLYSVLGQNPPKNPSRDKSATSNVVPLRATTSQVEDAEEVLEIRKNVPEVLMPIYKEDPSFDEKSFISGAQWAFGMIVENFAKGDLESISNFVSSKIKSSFQKAIDQRKKAGEIMETSVIAVKQSKILKTDVVKGIAFVTVKFVSDQATSLKDVKGNDLNPDQEEIEEVTDIWTFSRQVGSEDPNWTLETLHDVSRYEGVQDN